jgi:hypothetical protein
VLRPKSSIAFLSKKQLLNLRKKSIKSEVETELIYDFKHQYKKKHCGAKKIFGTLGDRV